jgi:hypothetical protein
MNQALELFELLQSRRSAEAVKVVTGSFRATGVEVGVILIDCIKNAIHVDVGFSYGLGDFAGNFLC